MTAARLLTYLQKQLPEVSFELGDSFFWSPAQQRITYSSQLNASQPQAIWALIHEASHAALNHQQYQSDLELLLLETEAWQKAKQFAKELGLVIEEDHIQDCLDTYRDWLHQRATCPRCSTVSLQSAPKTYKCHNCTATWQVSASRFCRPYRRQSLVTSL